MSRTAGAIALVLSLTLISPTVVHGQTALAYSVDWTLGVRFGVEKAVSPRFGLRGDLGIAALGQLIALDAMAYFGLLPDSERFDLRVYVGIPNLCAVITMQGAMASFGGSLAASWRVGTRSRMEFRAGGGFPLFFEKDKEKIRNIDFPLGLWPDATLSLLVPRKDRAP